MVKQEHDEFCRDRKTKQDELETRNENLNIELENKNHELRHYMERLKQQEEKFNSGLSLKVMEVNKLQQRLKEQDEKFISDMSLKEIEVKQLKQRLAGICEKRVKQDQRKVENILESNQRSEVENDFREFFDSDREDARDIIQSIYGSEEEVDVHVYYPRIACTIFVTAYEQAYDVKEAMSDLFKEIIKKVIHQAPEVVRNFRLSRTDGNFSFDSISNDDQNASENSTADVLDALLTSLKETSHICNLDCLEKEVAQSTWEKWNEWHNENMVFIHSPSWEVLSRLNSYIKACIRLTWRMVTQLPPLRLEYQSSNFDCRIHKKTAYHETIEKKRGHEESTEEIACYLWPGLIDGGERIIRPGDVIVK